MKKTYLIIILSLAALLGFLLILFGFMLPGRVRVFSEEIKYSSPNIAVNLKIPHINGLADRSYQAKINSELEDSVISVKDGMIADSVVFAEDVKAKGFPMRQFQLFQTYDVTCNSNGVLSFYTDTYQYSGGAHGVTERVSYNIDTRTGRALKLRDIFKNDRDYISRINREIEKQIAANPDVYFSNDSMKFKTITEDQPFYLVDGAVVIYFPLYEIAPYSTGIPEFRVPVSF